MKDAYRCEFEVLYSRILVTADYFTPELVDRRLSDRMEDRICASNEAWVNGAPCIHTLACMLVESLPKFQGAIGLVSLLFFYPIAGCIKYMPNV
ncbi:hypothetical protein GDO78_001737 [Eleutherodactylus coqui]|uniref:Uncharacterized protein n=1 Tax=Eleutherodactylus coqui TaxID=57060 RepID=A0A8J6FTV5_ELECQ|nr:hypothetical protein GDO78_001737 [Eleutherodactylus coqui]